MGMTHFLDLFGNLCSLISFRGVVPATENLICFISAAFGLACTRLNYTTAINLGTGLDRLYSVTLNDCISTPFIVLWPLSLFQAMQK